MANPRKFSEKIALQKQKQAEGTAEFERIMKEVYATKMDETQANQKILECCLASSNNEVNVGSGIGNGGSTNSGVASGGASPEGSAGGGAGGCSSPTAYRESRGRSVGVGPMRRPSERKQDRSPYGSNATTVGAMGLANNGQNIAYLSPPMDTSWRRSNSDSALHQSLNIAVAAEGNMGPGGLGGLPGDLGALHASYQHHNQRSHSPNIGRSYSPQAQRRKGNMIQLQQQQQQQQHHQQQLQMHQQQQIQQQHQLQQQQQLQQHHQQHHQQQHHHQQQQQQQQQQQHFNAKFYNCNIPANSLFKSLQEQAMAIANTGSLPDLTSVHYAAPAQQQMMQQQQQHPHPQQQQQTTLSPVLSPHHNQNSRGERDQSPSPFSPGGGGGNGGGPPSPYHQPQHSPTSAATTPVSTAQTSPHMSFTNLAVQSPCSPQQPAQTGGNSYGSHLPTLGAANSTGNLTDYRQPLNPPSPGSSPGLLTSVSGTELHSSAPSSPIRLPQSQTPLQQHMQQQQQGYNEKNIQNAFDRYSESAYNSLNPSFHNHFEQFSLGDGNSSPDQQLQQHFQQQHNNFAALDFEDFGGGGDVSGNSVPQQQHPTYTLAQNKLLNFNNLNTLRGGERNATTSATSSNSDSSNGATTTTCSNNNQQQQQHSGRTLANNQQQQQQQQRQLLNNNSSNRSTNATPTTSCRDNNNANILEQQQNDVSAIAASPAPQLSCLSSPSSPLPIPMPSHQHQQQQQQQQQHALSLSHTHSGHSPHHSPLHSPHHASPISASSPGLSTLGGSISPAASATTTAPTSNNQQSQSQQQHQHQHQQHQQQQQQQQQQQHHSNTTPTTTNIPSIIFSDYSSNSDFSREIFDTLDLDLGQMDVAGLQMLSDPSTIMIADPTIEDNFRRDLN